MSCNLAGNKRNCEVTSWKTGEYEEKINGILNYFLIIELGSIYKDYLQHQFSSSIKLTGLNCSNISSPIGLLEVSIRVCNYSVTFLSQIKINI